MNYLVRALRVYSVGGNTRLEDYSREVPTYTEAEKDKIRLKSLGDYSNIRIDEIKKPHPV